MTVLEIFIFRGEQFVGSRIFSEPTITIGRGSANLLTLDDRQISRLHASIVVDGERLVVRDESSQIGTLINGARIRECTFRETDSLTIGSFRLKVNRRSMRAGTDFDQDEPTDAGQAHLLRQQAGSLPGKGLASLISLHDSHPLPLPSPAPPLPGKEAAPALPTATAAPSPPASPAPPASVSHDSPHEELTAGLEDLSQIYLVQDDPRQPAPIAVKPAPVAADPVDEFASQAETVKEPDPRPLGLPVMPRVSSATQPTPVANPTANPGPDPVIVESAGPAHAEPTLALHRPAIAPMPGPSSVALHQAAPAQAIQEDHDDPDNEDEDDFVPSFSLLDMLDQDPVAQEGAKLLQLEIIQHRDGRILDIQQIPSKTNFPRSGRRLVRFEGDGRAQLAVTEEVSGHVYLNNRAIPLEEIRRGARDRKGVALLEMREGDHAAVVLTRPGSAAAPLSASEYHIRFVRIPDVRVTSEQLSVRLLSGVSGYRWLFGALSLHLLLLVGLSLLPGADPQTVAEEARFAQVSIKSIQVEPPPEVKPPEPVPEIKPEIKPEAPRVMKPVKMVRTRGHATPHAAAPTGAQRALAALDLLKPADTASPLKDAVSNISAVSVPADTRSRFKIGGAIGKLPVGEVRVSTAGVASDATSSGRELLSKEHVGALKGGGSGNVRGVVKQAPAAALQSAGAGRLSRAQIQKVINEHVAQVQACYEKNLMRDHSLAGKITFDWVIAPTGSVSSARVRSSTMAGSAVSTCILQEIRGWIFPTPEGGSVSVTYPFIFSAQGF